YAWLASAAAAMGGGIWSMHFVGILAYTLPVPVSYDLDLTLLSLALPILVTGAGFAVVHRYGTGPLSVLASGVFMGLGIVAMHYTGMAAMRLAADVSYDRQWVAISVVIAIGAATTALWLVFRNGGISLKIAAAIAMGFAISGMHYSAMRAAIFMARSNVEHAHAAADLDPTGLASAVAIVTLVVLSLALVASQVDRRFALLSGERLRAEEALLESERRLLHLADASPSILWSAVSDGTITWASESWYRYTGLPALDVLDWEQCVHPDDRERRRATWAAALREQSVFEIEVRYRRHDGRYRWFITRGAPRRDCSGRVTWYGAATDIDDLKRAEQALRESESRFRTVFNQQFQFMAILFPDGVVRACNDTFYAATGVRSEAVLGRHFWNTPWWSGLREEQRWWQAAIQSAVTSGQASTGEVALANADGSRCQAEFAVSGVRDEEGRVIDVIAEGRDITQRKRWEEQQNLLTKELAHRIKNSMAVIQSIARQTLRDAPNSFAEAFTGRVQSLAAAHDILLEKGWVCANLKDLADRQLAVADGRVRLAGPDVALSPTLATSLGLVLHELVTNASKYGALSAPQGAVELSWQVAADDGHRHVHLTWKERHGPRVAAPDHAGFGSTLIERSLPGATVERRFEPEGLLCTIDLPLA
ncbi:MAG TPA: MHYT domain-containing protein, partial [Hyphomicrobiaceae bacterium]|nr:MHYT domain-containing protein [Hyphomicrobiaceae bacterium]